MIGKPQWFKRRKYGGWGFYPSCWQGWLYLVILMGSIALIQFLPLYSERTRFAITAAWVVVFAMDAIHIFVGIPKDERETLHEAKAERNALWAMILVLIAGLAYQAADEASKGAYAVDPVIIVALGAGLVVKAATNVYFDSKD